MMEVMVTSPILSVCMDADPFLSRRRGPARLSRQV
jgi:hypothetical protein